MAWDGAERSQDGRSPESQNGRGPPIQSSVTNSQFCALPVAKWISSDLGRIKKTRLSVRPLWHGRHDRALYDVRLCSIASSTVHRLASARGAGSICSFAGGPVRESRCRHWNAFAARRVGVRDLCERTVQMLRLFSSARHSSIGGSAGRSGPRGSNRKCTTGPLRPLARACSDSPYRG